VGVPIGPVEVVVIEFPGNRFTGEIMPELERLVDQDVVTIIDGLLAVKDDRGDVAILELGELDANEDASALARLLDQLESLVSDEDVEELAAGLEPGSSAAILVFEHTWAKPLRDAIVSSGGRLALNFRVPGLAVDELLAELAAIDEAEAAETTSN
jgi:hypothetical protein